MQKLTEHEHNSAFHQLDVTLLLIIFEFIATGCCRFRAFWCFTLKSCKIWLKIEVFFSKSVTAHQVLLALENVDGFASMNFDVFFIKSFKDKAIFRSLNFYYPILLLAKGTYAEVNTYKEKRPIYFNLIFSIQILSSQKDIFSWLLRSLSLAKCCSISYNQD